MIALSGAAVVGLAIAIVLLLALLYFVSGRSPSSLIPPKGGQECIGAASRLSRRLAEERELSPLAVPIRLDSNETVYFVFDHCKVRERFGIGVEYGKLRFTGGGLLTLALWLFVALPFNIISKTIAEVRRAPRWRIVARGPLYLTNQRALLDSNREFYSWWYPSILKVEPRRRGVILSDEGGSSRLDTGCPTQSGWRCTIWHGERWWRWSRPATMLLPPPEESVASGSAPSSEIGQVIQGDEPRVVLVEPQELAESVRRCENANRVHKGRQGHVAQHADDVLSDRRREGSPQLHQPVDEETHAVFGGHSTRPHLVDEGYQRPEPVLSLCLHDLDQWNVDEIGYR